MRCPEKTSGVTVKAGECGKSDQKQGVLGNWHYKAKTVLMYHDF